MPERLQKWMADCGVASRRQCEQMILEGRVLVNGKVRSELPVLIEPKDDVVSIDGVALQQERPVYLLLNKPKGILVTREDPADRKTVYEMIGGVKERVFPVGRLDMDSRGLLIMTNDGELANRLTHPRFGIEKTYIVEIEGALAPLEIERIKRGVWLGPEFRGQSKAIKTERFKVKLLGRERGRTILEVSIAEGKNREIRRVLARVGHPVRDLNRVAIADKITSEGLPVGRFRPLTDAEVKWLIKASSPEFHEQKKSATQRWFEEKEMEKERKRLASGQTAQPAAESKKSFVRTPAKWGKKVVREAPSSRPPSKHYRNRPAKAAPAAPAAETGPVARGPRPTRRTQETLPPPRKPRSQRLSHPLGSDAVEEQ